MITVEINVLCCGSIEWNQ